MNEEPRAVKGEAVLGRYRGYDVDAPAVADAILRKLALIRAGRLALEPRPGGRIPRGQEAPRRAA